MSKSQRSNRGTAKFSHLQLKNNGETGNINVSPCQGISKYFTRASSSQQKPPEFNSPFLNKTKEIVPNLKSDDDDDFKPVKPIKIARIFTNPKTGSNVTRKKYTKKVKTKKGDNLIQKTLSDNFGQDDVNPEHLQIALALSKSVQDQACSQENSRDVPIYPSTQVIKENARDTLAQFAFKSSKSEDIIWPLKSYTEVSRKKKKSKFSCVTPILLLRTNEERDALISSKVSSILANNILNTPPDDCLNESLNVYSNILQKYHCRQSKLFQMTILSKCDRNDLFYVEKLNFERDITKCGDRLKKWEEIPGRALSPPRIIKKPVLSIDTTIVDNINKTLSTIQSMVDYCINDVPTETIADISIYINEDNATSIPDFTAISPKKNIEIERKSISPKVIGNDEIEKNNVKERKTFNRSPSPDLFDSDEANQSPVIQKFKRIVPTDLDVSEELKSDDDDCDILDNGVCYFESFCEDEVLISQKCMDTFTTDDKKSPIIDDGGGKLQNTSIVTFDLTQEETILLKHNSNELEVKTRQSLSIENTSLFQEETFLLESNSNQVDKKQYQYLQKRDLSEDKEETIVLDHCYIQNDSIDKLDFTEEVLKSNTSLSETKTLKTEDYDFAEEKTVSMSSYKEDKSNISKICGLANQFKLERNSSMNEMNTIIVDKQNESINMTQTLNNEHGFKYLESKYEINNSIKNYNFMALEEDFLNCNSTIDSENEEHCIKSHDDNFLKTNEINDFAKNSKHSECTEIEDDSDKMKQTDHINSSKDDSLNLTHLINYLRHDKKADVIDLCHDSNDSDSPEHLSNEIATFKSKLYEAQSKSTFKISEDEEELCNEVEEENELLNNQKLDVKEMSTEELIKSVDDAINKFKRKSINANDSNESQESCAISDEELNYSSYFHTPNKLKTKYNQLEFDDDNDIIEIDDSDDDGVADDLYTRDTPISYNDFATTSSSKTTPTKENISKVNVKDIDTEYMICDDNVGTNLDNNSLLKKVIHPRVRDLSARKSYGFNDTFGNLLEQSKFIKQIENRLDPVNEKTPVKEKPIEVQTTPDNGMIIKTTDITPMPDYESMGSPEIVQELNKFGVKKLKRQRGISMLKYLYESTHPSSYDVPERDPIEEQRSAKRRRKLIVEDEFKSREPKSVEIIADVNAGETREDMIFEKKISKKIASCQVPMHIAFHNLVTSDPNLQENILFYEPLQVEVLYDMLKEQGYKYHLQDLITFLDRKCITFRLNQANK